MVVNNQIGQGHAAGHASRILEGVEMAGLPVEILAAAAQLASRPRDKNGDADVGCAVVTRGPGCSIFSCC
jgi:hypothetical protein